MTIREAIDAIVSHGRRRPCHSERPPRIVAADRIFAKPALSDAEGEPWVGQTIARRTWSPAMTIRDAIDAIVSHGRRPACHSERSPCSVAVDRTFAKNLGWGRPSHAGSET
jgi:hypothetical protein